MSLPRLDAGQTIGTARRMDRSEPCPRGRSHIGCTARTRVPRSRYRPCRLKLERRYPTPGATDRSFQGSVAFGHSSPSLALCGAAPHGASLRRQSAGLEFNLLVCDFRPCASIRRTDAAVARHEPVAASQWTSLGNRRGLLSANAPRRGRFPVLRPKRQPSLSPRPIERDGYPRLGERPPLATIDRKGSGVARRQ